MIPVVDPSTEEVLGEVPEAGPAGVDAAVARARAAFGPWAATPLQQRLAALEALATALEGRAATIGHTLAREMGMPVAQATAVQAALPVGVLRATVAAARRFPFETTEDGALVLREPAGVVAAITPWNFPLHQIAAKLGPALAVGCTVVLKPSELAPLCVGELVAAARDAGLPDGVLEVVHGTGPVTGRALVEHQDVDVVSFTGSLAAGREIGAAAGRAIRRACLELGGKSPLVVLPDADVEAAVRHAVTRCCFNSGQACNAPTRLLLPAERAADATALAGEVARGLRVGPALQDGVDVGPVISAAARDRLRGVLRDTEATLVAGGPDDPPDLPDRGFWVAPTVLADVRPGMRVHDEELFGPILSVTTYTDEEDAVRLANATPYGLSAELYGADPDAIDRVARRLRAGQVKVGGVSARATLGAPFGGYGLSGLGRELGTFGLEEFTEVKAVLGV
ncbi:aldehyde dehydrogenase family protein [Paraconexibacter algicola]|uniref:Aldehyde dehydrogenase family protein n=1 Tax=Paraconexibacter algicola TaxID=2133960 RepID=A0A2T4UJU7_9ACTN|nr:aldehyde dehydrogenase family protein [Paraconexibacter algicola]PTL59523.1 aldehyde dehydrogenase family protein [Paraconexibacter algicola]